MLLIAVAVCCLLSFVVVVVVVGAVIWVATIIWGVVVFVVINCSNLGYQVVVAVAVAEWLYNVEFTCWGPLDCVTLILW